MNIDFISDINRGYEKAMNYQAVDKFIIKVHWWSFGALIILAILNSVIKIATYYPSPFSWRGISAPEALLALAIGFAAAIIPTVLVGKMSNHYLWRVLATATLTFYAYLIVFISGGAIEMHFIFFAMVTLVVIYSDWRLGWIMLVLVGLHHGILNYIAPTWVYFYGRNDFAIVAHALPVLIAVIFTTILAENNRKSILDLEDAKTGLEKTVAERTWELKQTNMSLDEKIKEKTAELAKLNRGLEGEVAKRTSELQTRASELEQMNTMMIGRELKMAELKGEIEELKSKLK